VVEFVTRVDVAVQRGAVELSQNVDTPDSRVQAIADGDIDETVLCPDWNSGFGPAFGQRKKTFSCPAPHDDGKGSGCGWDDMLDCHKKDLSLYLAKSAGVCQPLK
jgi:hypothetical protein